MKQTKVCIVDLKPIAHYVYNVNEAGISGMIAICPGEIRGFFVLVKL